MQPSPFNRFSGTTWKLNSARGWPHRDIFSNVCYKNISCLMLHLQVLRQIVSHSLSKQPTNMKFASSKNHIVLMQSLYSSYATPCLLNSLFLFRAQSLIKKILIFVLTFCSLATYGYFKIYA